MSLRIDLLVAAATLIGCDGGGGFPDAPQDPPERGGTFTLAWTVTDSANNNQLISCDRVGAQNVTVELRSHQTANAFHDSFGCSGGKSTSGIIPAGTYDLTIELTGIFGTLATVEQVNIAIAESQDTALEPVLFAVDAHGALAMHLDTQRPGGNCGAISANGAGITAMTLTLQHASGGCEPLTLTIAPGATKPGGTYTINCASPQVAPCIEDDQALTAGNVPSDGYKITVRGKIGATNCWVNDDTLQVPPLGKTLTQTFNLAKLATPGC